MPAAGGSIVVATHNVMHGRRLDALVSQYLDLRGREGLDLFCLQEDRFLGGEAGLCPNLRPSARIAAALGDGYQVVRDDGAPGLAFIIDGRRVSCRRERDHSAAPPGVALLVRAALHRGREGQAKARALGRAARSRRARPFTAVSFHLDTAGGQRQRAAQTAALAAALAERDFHRRLVLCGDTNAFSWRRGRRTLDALLAPFAAFGAADPETRPTHHFARQNEPMLPHRIGVALGKLGLDIPLRYDVVCTNLAASARGHLVTPGSDHDLVWARLSLRGTQGE